MQARIMREYKEVSNLGPDSYVGGFLPDTSKIQHWKGWIKGPDESPFEDGVFIIDITLPADYPFSAPKMKFDTKIWHPNISSQTGAICLDILKDEWSPALTIRTALLSVQALLTEANPTDPQDAVVARQYTDNRLEYNQKATEWTKLYAECNLGYFKGKRRSAEERAAPKLYHGKPLNKQNATQTPVPVEKYVYQDQLNQLKEMGFPDNIVKPLLQKHKGDLERVLTELTN